MSRLIMLACAYALSYFLLFVGADSKPSASLNLVEIRKEGERLLLRIEENANTVHEFEMKLDTGLFSPTAMAVHGNGESIPIATRHTYLSTRTTATNWATATVEAETQDRIQISGLVSLNGKVHEIYSDKNDDEKTHRLRRLDETTTATIANEFKDIVIRNPDRDPHRGLPPLTTMKSMDGAFFPGCYPFDDKTLKVQISIATDWGYVQRVNRDNPDSSVASWTNMVLSEVERNLRLIRPIYLGQLNVLLEVQQVVIGSKTFPDADVLRRERAISCRIDPLDSLADFGSWVKNHAQPSAHWHLFSDCYPMPGVVGVGYEYGLCDTFGRNTAISSWQFDGSMYRTVAHEMGHVFGGEHTFYDGKGGLMDYGSGRLFGGELQFHPDNRPQMCSELTEAVNRKCRFVQLMAGESKCGNGMLEPDEECECRDNTQLCGVCQRCVLTQARECTIATDPFVIRQPLTATIVTITDPKLVSHADCCNSERKLAGKSCNSLRDVCSATGSCEKACTRFGVASCGFFDSTGCIQMCLDGGICKGAELETMGPPKYPAGSVPDGVKCKSKEGKAGTCTLGACITGEPTNSPTSPVTRSPTSKAPTPAVTGTPTKLPTTSKPTSASPTFKPKTLSPSFKLSTLKPTTLSPTFKPSTSRPSSSAPSVKPTTASPTVKPTTARPTSKSPTIKPTTARPTSKSPTIKPTTARPTSKSPTIKPTAARPTSKSPTPKPSSASPTRKPTVASPTKKPTTARPTTAAPTTASPMTGATSSPAVREELPTAQPTVKPTPSRKPSRTPTARPTKKQPPTVKISQNPTWFPSLAPTLSARSQAPSTTPSLAPSSMFCPSIRLFYRCPPTKTQKACKKQGCTWCGKANKCQVNSTVCNAKAAASAVYPNCPPFVLAMTRLALGSDNVQCPLKVEMLACSLTKSAKGCAKNAHLKCKWCSSQKVCVPVTSDTPCSFSACPKAP